MDRDRSMDIAVIGVSGRFPGAANLDQWWSALLAGQVLTTRYQRDELLEAGVQQTLLDDPNYIPVHGHLANADRFDNKLFRVSSRDAELMDPQHRLMLEAAWSALEDAGYNGPSGCQKTGVFASGSGSGYLRTMLTQGPLDPDTLEQALHGTEPDFIASLIAYKLNLTGPAVAVQTACSSSLVSVHFAIQALLNGDCDQALVVAAGISFPQAGYIHMPGGIKSATGACHPFDERADGVLEGSGVACVVLQRLEDAIEGPEIYGVILGTAINNDGASKVGYYAPSVSGQAAVIHAALRAADVDATSIRYLETHGTGTHIGDPIEWTATSEAYNALGASPKQIAVGALKANIGHLDAAAGLASLIKALRIVKEGIIPPVAGFGTLNPLLEINQAPLYVPTKVEQWHGDGPRRAAISAFGIGGTNAHVIIEQPPQTRIQSSTTNQDTPKMVMLSAADPEALTRAAVLLKKHLQEKTVALSDVSYTLAMGRSVLPERLIVCGRTSQEIANKLNTNIGIVRGHAPLEGAKPVIFMFPGQGGQYPGMALPFVSALPGFSAALDTCLLAFDALSRDKIRNALLTTTFPEAELNETILAQPALFALEYVIANSLIKMGVSASAVIGHSLGEITAACLAGTLNLADAASLVVARGQAMQNCKPGAMLAVNLSAAQVNTLIMETQLPLSIASVNTFESCVVAGSIVAIEAFRHTLSDEIICRLLNTNRAFHSPLIEPAITDLQTILQSITLRQLKLPIALNATGQILETGTTIAAESFLVQARQAVQFAAALSNLGKRYPEAIFVEIGVGRTLSSMATALNLKAMALAPNKTNNQSEAILSGIGTLWTLGYPIAPSSLCAADGKRVHLPTYPFFGPRWMAPEAAAGLHGRPRITEQPVVEPITLEFPQEVFGRLASIWSELLNHNELDEQSDFFWLGGDSLLTVSLLHRVKLAFGVQVSPRTMLAARTLGQQVTIIRQLLEQHTESKTA